MIPMQRRYQIFVIFMGVLAFFLLSGFGIFGHKKYETPITKETLQPDKILFDRAIKNIEHGDYEAARLTLNTLINTYDTSEYLAKAKLAIADSWFREGGSHGLAQAEAEYKDFILFYPNMEEAAESQFKVCNIHFKQMDKADRDNTQGQRAEDECRQVMVQFPNSKFVAQAQQMLRDVQEVLADKEFRTGLFYHTKGSFPAAANRLSFVSQQYPLYSGADEALWLDADAYRHMGDRFEEKEVDSLTRIVRDYPLSLHVNAAKERLTAMKRPVPQADPAAYARMKYDLENRTRVGLFHRTLGVFEGRPDVSLAAKSGAPAMQAVRPAVPVSVPAVAAGGQNGISDVSATVAGNSEAIDKEPEARLGVPAAAVSAAGVPATDVPPASGTGEGEQKAALSTPAARTGTNSGPGPQTNSNIATSTAGLPTNHPPTKAQLKAYKQQQDKAAKQQKKTGATAATATPAATTPAATTPGATTPAATTTPAANQPAQQ
jgi:outer membrane protein assembly factor BamD